MKGKRNVSHEDNNNSSPGNECITNLYNDIEAGLTNSETNIDSSNRADPAAVHKPAVFATVPDLNTKFRVNMYKSAVNLIQ